MLKNGEVQEVGSAQDILHNPQHPYTKELLAAFEPAARVHPDEPAAAKPTPILAVENVMAGYGTVGKSGLPAVVAVNNVSLELVRGQNLGIIGESGCGKSTLARVIAGILPAVQGRILFDGKELQRDLRKRSRDQLRELQIVFQFADTALNPAKSIADILARPLVFYHGMDHKAREARIDQLLDMVRLPRSLRYRQPGELSGGQKQRINLARALAADPKVILCDEITSALDTVVAAAIIDLLKELQRELMLSYIFISHDLSTVRAICDEVVVMYAGRKIEQLSPDAMGDSASHPYSRLLFSSVPKLDTNWLNNLDINSELVRQFTRD